MDEWPWPHGSRVKVHYPGGAFKGRGTVIGWDDPFLWIRMEDGHLPRWVCKVGAWVVTPT